MSETDHASLKVRAVYAFSRFYLLDDFRNNDAAAKCIEILKYQLKELDEVFNLDTQMIEKNIYMNLFWMKEKVLIGDIVETMEEKLKESEAKEKIASKEKSTAAG